MYYTFLFGCLPIFLQLLCYYVTRNYSTAYWEDRGLLQHKLAYEGAREAKCAWMQQTYQTPPKRTTGATVAEWVGALDWRLGGPGFESRCGKFALELLAISFTPLCQCLSEETLKAVGPFYLASMPGEVKNPTSLHWICVTCRGLHRS